MAEDKDKICVISKDPALRRPIPKLDFLSWDPKVYFPSEWFNKHPDAKPTLLIMPNTEKPRADVRRTVLANLDRGTLDCRIAVAFLFQEFRAKPAMNTVEWRSFDRLISEPNQKVDISALFDLQIDEVLPDFVAGPEMPPASVQKYVVIICAIYRLIQINQPTYKDKICNSANQLLKKMNYGCVDFHSLSRHYVSWSTNPHFKRVIAGIDMFLYRFPKHEYASARFGTIGSRYLECSAFTDLQFLHKLTSMTYTEISHWIWTKKVADQFRLVFRETEEMELEQSYAPYMMDMGLSIKSPYGAKVNPEMHFWVNVIGATLLEERSINAKIVGVIERFSTLKNAAVVAFVLRYAKQFGTVDEKNVDGDEEKIEREAGMPTDRDPDLWLKYVQHRKNTAPDPILRTLARIWSRFTETRKETIGRFLYEESVAILHE